MLLKVSYICVVIGTGVTGEDPASFLRAICPIVPVCVTDQTLSFTFDSWP